MNNSVADIVIADDHNLFRKGMRALLEDFDFIGNIYEAENGVELLELLKHVNPKPLLVLLDIIMPVMDGLEAHKKIRELFPQIKVIVLTMEDDQQLMLHLIMEGVNGYLLKNTDPEELETALKKLLKNDYYFPADIAQMVLKNAERKKNSLNAIPDFNEKELKILNLICKEYTANEIAEMMFLSTRTVEGYRSRLLEKTNSKNIAGLVVYALKHKLVVI
ncbi:MAG TPA: response regulator transcription factor [Mariniphaga sp.]|nr:response regulator transcription factor [Mariniphaga sp.]